MPRRLLLLCALTGCFDDRGARLVVSTPTGTKSVEVFLSFGECTELDAQNMPQPCSPNLAWSANAGPRTGKIFDLDFQVADRGEAVTIAEVSGDRTVIALEADKPKYLSRVVLVGYSDDPLTNPASANSIAILHDVEVPADRGEIWEVELEPAATIPDVPNPPTATRVRVWRRPGGTVDAPTAACVAVEKPIDGDRFEFLVPHDDPDCDAKLPECAAFIPNFSSSSLERNCAVIDADGQIAPVCVLGNRTCVDGTPRDMACGLLLDEYCVPDAVCTCVDPFDRACLRDVLAPATYTGPRFTCTLAFDRSAPSGESNLCSTNNLDKAVMSLTATLGAVPCTALEVGLLGVPVMFSPNATVMFEPALSWTINKTNSCDFEIRLAGRHEPNDTTTHTVLAAFQIDPTSHIAIPAHVTWVPVDGCGTADPAQFGCHPQPNVFDADLPPFTCAF